MHVSHTWFGAALLHMELEWYAGMVWVALLHHGRHSCLRWIPTTCNDAMQVQCWQSSRTTTTTPHLWVWCACTSTSSLSPFPGPCSSTCVSSVVVWLDCQYFCWWCYEALAYSVSCCEQDERAILASCTLLYLVVPLLAHVSMHNMCAWALLSCQAVSWRYFRHSALPSQLVWCGSVLARQLQGRCLACGWGFLSASSATPWAPSSSTGWARWCWVTWMWCNPAVWDKHCVHAMVWVEKMWETRVYLLRVCRCVRQECICSPCGPLGE